MPLITEVVGRTRFFARKLRHPIPSKGLVLDVGSGGDPHPRADVIVDRVIGADAQRTFAFRKQGHVVVGDIEGLPFKDDAFAYVLCSHVLEHVRDPALAAAELSRVGVAGYVETPSDVHEFMFPIGWHRWTVRKDGEILVFRGKDSPLLNDVLGRYFREKWGRDRTFMSFVWNHTNELFVQHHWTGSLGVRVESEPTWSLEDCLPSTMGDAPVDSSLKRALYSFIARIRYTRPSSIRR